MKELEEIFETDEFKSLPRYKRILIRSKIAFYQTISFF